AAGGGVRVAIDGGYVYYTTWVPNEGGVWRVPQNGGSVQRLSTTPYCDYLLVDATDVYYDSPSSSYGKGGIWRVPKQGGTVVSVSQQSDEAQGMAIDATHIYWADFQNVWKVSKNGGAATIVAAKQQNARSIAMD